MMPQIVLLFIYTFYFLRTLFPITTITIIILTKQAIMHINIMTFEKIHQ